MWLATEISQVLFEVLVFFFCFLFFKRALTGNTFQSRKSLLGKAGGAYTATHLNKQNRPLPVTHFSRHSWFPLRDPPALQQKKDADREEDYINHGVFFISYFDYLSQNKSFLRVAAFFCGISDGTRAR